jgi:hypothetical protein
MTLKDTLISTGMHVLELAVILVVSYVATQVLNLPINDQLIVLVLASLTKFARSSESVPVQDYVNDIKE